VASPEGGDVSRDREHDKWIPWYVEDTPGWLELSLAARGAMEGIARKLNDKTGRLTLRRGLPSLALLLHVSWAELEPALAELVASGKLEWDGAAFQLIDPEYVERRRHSSADRMAAKRARDRGKEVTPVTSPPSLPSHVTPVTAVLVSSTLISSESDLGSDARDLPTGVRERIVEPITEVGPPPAWFPTAVDVVAMNTGIALPVGEAWLRYDGHRQGKGLPRTQPDAQYWLTTVMVPEAREVLRRATRDKDRDAKFDRDKRFAKEGPEKPPPPTKAQAQAFADQLEARLRAQKAAGTR
jgi:hypothetical protein